MAALKLKGELFVIDPEEVGNAGVQAVHADRIFCNVVRRFVGLPDR